MFLFLTACQPDPPAPCTTCDTATADTDTTPDTDTDTTVDTDDTDTDTLVETGETGETGDPPRSPPLVILFIGDGMGFEQVEGGGLYKNGAAGSLTMEGLPNRGRLVTASLEGVTDSAAGATALGAGIKTLNHVVGMDRDLAPVESLTERARARGMSTGVITTDTLTGATPASFMAHVMDRGEREEIAAQIAASPPDVLLGGGLYELVSLLDPALVDIFLTRDALLGSVPGESTVAGLFSASEFPYVAEGYTEEPTLAEMTRFALDRVGADPAGAFLMIEGARIDHASHANQDAKVHPETAAFDDAIEVALAWVEETGIDATIVVTADHECGGIEVTGASAAGTIPATDWRWGDHTNADVPVYATGRLTETFDGQRLDNTWVHAVLSAVIEDADDVTPPVEAPLTDGRTDELPVVVTQTRETSYGLGYNQLDALRVMSDERGLHVGVDGVFERDQNTTLLLVDMDFGAGTGWVGGGLTDAEGTLDTLLTRLPYVAGVDGLGFDLAFGAIGALEVRSYDLDESAGLRGMAGRWGTPEDIWWLPGISNFDDGNIAEGAPARDAGGTGATEGGWEILLAWEDLYPDGVVAGDIAIAVVLANDFGDAVSNQALPPLAEESSQTITSVVVVSVDAAGTSSGAAVVP
jgi:alkaline phosphatase